MPNPRTFTFGAYTIDTERSVLKCTYEIEFENGDRQQFKDELIFHGATPEMWRRIPAPTLHAICESLLLICGINYWKIHCAPRMRIPGFTLTKEQASFWDTVYTKGLAEFFYRSRKDFRGLVSFPFAEVERDGALPSFEGSPRVLLAQGGGKDSIVSAEMLREHGVAFDVFVEGRTSMQEKAIAAIGRPAIRVTRRRDAVARELARRKLVASGYPSVTTHMFIATLAALLHDYRYVMFSNESSADIPNMTYLGLDVNHQWSKSREAELLVRDHIASNITKDVELFSLIHQYSELEMVRRFSAYPRYFFSFSSCNTNFITPAHIASARHGRAFWCNACAKCVFMFAALSAFVPKDALLEIFGMDIYKRQDLIPLFKQLLGIEGTKPFDCVGSPEEMIVAMRKAEQTGDYRGEVVMNMFSDRFKEVVTDEMESRVFAPQGESTAPVSFALVR